MHHMPDAASAVKSVVTTPIAAVKRNPVVWVVVFVVVAVVVIRYRETILGWLGKTPVVGARVLTFAR